MRTTHCFVLAVLCTGGCVVSTDDDAASEDLEVARDLPEVCRSAEVVRIARPASDVSPDDTFEYGFRYAPPTTPGAPVLVYLPGGPGQGSMESAPAFVPAGWGYLMTDPRGVGCNRLAALPAAEHSGEFFSTHEIADDVIAAIADRQLTNYILFGISYGTALATTVEHELEARGGITPPAAVVLEGVLGRAFGDDFVGAEYITQWDRVRAVLPADVITELDTAAAPYGISAVGWSKILTAVMPEGPGPASELLYGLSTTQAADVQSQTLDALTGVANSDELPAPGEVELYRQVACRELMDTVPASDLDVVFAGGELVRNSAEEGTKCRELHVTTPYDSAQLQFTAPVFLFVGDSDVATPAWQGAYHFDHHAGSAVRVVTKNGGHNSLEFNQVDCAPALMASIAAGGADLETVAAGCPMQTTIDRK